MVLLSFLLDFGVLSFAAWTIAYLIVLYARLPAWTVAPLTAVLLLPLARLALRLPTRLPCQTRRDLGPLLATIVAGGLAGLALLFLGSWNPDDGFFYHRALVQLQDLRSPFLVTDTLHDTPFLPALSTPHLLSAYEPLVALAAHALGIDPLWAYHNGAAFAGMTLLTASLTLLFREFRLRPWLALLATILSLTFMVLEPGKAQSYGMAVWYIWMGKFLLLSAGVPIGILLCTRFLRRPSARTFILVTAVPFCAIGLAGSGLFLAPVLILAASLAYLIAFGWRRTRVRRVLLLNLASLGSVIVTALIFVRPLTPLSTISAWIEPFPSVWWRNLALIIHGPRELARDLWLLLVLPLAAVPGPRRRYVVALTLALAAVFANPLLGPLWMRVVLPAAYWRLVLLFPVVWVVGLVVQGFHRRAAWPRRLTAAVSVALMGWVWYGSGSDRIPLASRGFKSPGEYRFTRDHLAFARGLPKGEMRGAFLTPLELTAALPLLFPALRFEATRTTRHTFINAGLPRQAEKRLLAERVAECDRSARAERAFRESISRLDGLITWNCGDAHSAWVSDQLERRGGWERVFQDGDYVVYLRRSP